MKQEVPYKIYLAEDEIPTQWYNVRADMKNKPAPLLNPATGKPLTQAELEAVFCSELVPESFASDKLKATIGVIFGFALMMILDIALG